MDHTDDGTWMTKAELGKSRGISATSAERLIRRHKTWPRRTGNDGLLRVLVPASAITSDDTPDVTARTAWGASAPDTRTLTVAFERAIQAWQERAERAEHKVDEAEGRAVAAEARADREGVRADRAAGEIERLRAELDRRKGLLARIRAAFR